MFYVTRYVYQLLITLWINSSVINGNLNKQKISSVDNMEGIFLFEGFVLILA
jgi:hypothetical protein